MRTSNGLARSAAVLAILVSTGGTARAAVELPPPSSPVPPGAGTGLSSSWVKGAVPSDFEELDRALTFLTPTSFVFDGVGPVSFSNNLAPIGDFATHTAMPYSTEGLPADNGWYLASRMTGAWAARQAGTYTFAIASDDGYRVTLAGTVILEHAPAQPFRREAASFVANGAGLYPIVVEYFNGVEEGALELSFAPGEVALASESAPVPSVFALIPLVDLYPPTGLELADGGAPASPGLGDDGGAASSGGSTGATSSSGGTVASSSGAGGADASVGSSGADEAPVDSAWHGGGCAVGAVKPMAGASPVSVSAILFAALAALARRFQLTESARARTNRRSRRRGPPLARSLLSPHRRGSR